MFSREDTRSSVSNSSTTSSDRKDASASLYSNGTMVSSAEKLDATVYSRMSHTPETPLFGNLDLHISNTRLVSAPSSVVDSPNGVGKAPLRPNTGVSSTVKDPKGNVIKRKYSRNGCAECKRRRMKCDETKPTCWQCARLNRDCVYILNPKNKKKSSRNNDGTVSISPYDDNNSNDNDNNEDDNNNDDNNNDDNITDLRYYRRTTLDSEKANAIPNKYNHENNLSNGMTGYNANLLIQNLNDIVNMKLHDSFILNDELKDLGSFEFDLPEFISSNSPVKSVPISFHMKNTITFNTELSSLKLTEIHEKYLKVFYYDCMDSIAPFFQDQGNPLRDILLSFAKSESYLLSAILAVGASISHRKSEDLEDEKNYCQYLSHCLKFLDEQFQNESNVLEKIEPIILTVIMLAWDCIYTMNSQWRSHLKGIIDLFKKINASNSSKVLNVAKCWFRIMETFASISTIYGGSLTEECDIDLIFDPYDFQYVDSLKYLNIITPLNEFNLLRGHKEDFDIVIREVIKSLNKTRRSSQISSDSRKIISGKLNNLPASFQRNIVSPGDESEEEEVTVSYFAIQKILVEIDRQLEYEFIDKSGVIPIDSQSHPKNSQIKDNAIDLVILRNGEEIAISWYDISHQTQVLSFLLIVLLKLMKIPKTLPVIQEVVKRIMSFFRFLDSENPAQNSRTCYSNFAVLLAGLHAVDDDIKYVIRRYYKVNGNKFSRLSEHNLNRLEEVWAGNDSAKLTEQDILTW